MSSPMISVTNLSKTFDLSYRPSAIRHSLQGFRKQRNQAPIQALRGVNFTVSEGEVVGIVGRNGAGKSTLLKILSGLMWPDEGGYTMRSIASSMLEVGTGFHPDLTGKENVFLSGALLGMSKAEIEKHYEAIVSFASVEDFMDVQVRYYSSGMYTRLGFAVASFLQSKILIIDEVLAVGDSIFKQKCSQLIEQQSSEKGKTILVVSHDMLQIRRLCSRVIVLEQGAVVFDGPTDEGLAHYLNPAGKSVEVSISPTGIRLADVSLRYEGVDVGLNPASGIEFGVFLSAILPQKVPELLIEVDVLRLDGTVAMHLSSTVSGAVFSSVSGQFSCLCTVPKLPLVQGRYFLTIRYNRANTILAEFFKAYEFEVEGSVFFPTGRSLPSSLNALLVDNSWISRGD